MRAASMRPDVFRTAINCTLSLRDPLHTKPHVVDSSAAMAPRQPLDSALDVVLTTPSSAPSVSAPPAELHPLANVATSPTTKMPAPSDSLRFTGVLVGNIRCNLHLRLE